MNERKRPTILRTLDADYTAALALMAPFIFWLLFWFLSILHIVDLQILRYIVIALSIGSLLFAAWRCWLIGNIFTSGVDTQAEVQHIWFSGDRGRLVFTFIWERAPLQKNSMIPKNDYTESLREGQSIMVMVDPHQPKRAFVRDLYLRSPLQK
jgi:hypothetical protein